VSGKSSSRLRTLAIAICVVAVVALAACDVGGGDGDGDDGGASSGGAAGNASVCNYYFEWLDRVRFPLQADPHAAYTYVVPR
jgi:hypothetical protein